MRIHLQSHRSPHNFPLTPELWDAAVARAQARGLGVATGHDVTFGDDPAAFQAACPTLELLVSQTHALADLIPFQAPNLKMVYATSAGLDRLMPLTWLPPGIPILNNRGTHAAKAGEYGIMALLMLACRIPALVTAQRDGAWRPLHGSVLAGRHAVFVGLGALGGSAAAQARNFGMQVTGVRATPAPHGSCHQVVTVDALDEVLPQAEFLFMATPLTDATRGLLSRERIARLPKGAGVVNIGRGGLIDQDALLDALDSGHLGGAVLDVFTPEPIPPGHRLWTTPNLLVTPHVSADDPATYNAYSLDIFLDNLQAHHDGRTLPNQFHPDRGY